MTATTEPIGLPPGPLSVVDLEGLPHDGHRYELLDGVLIVSPAPRRLHQRAVGRLYRLLDDAAPDHLETLVAPFAVRPEGDLPLPQQWTELQPDVLVARVADLTDRDLPTAPLLAVEVLSPSTRLVDLNLKSVAYQRMGAHSFWVVDPDAPDVRIFELDDDGAYRLIAHVSGDETFVCTRPFVVSVRPRDLVSHG